MTNTTPLVSREVAAPRRTGPAWSPLLLAAALFAAAWVAFAVLHAVVGSRADRSGLADMDGLLATCAAVTAVVFGTLTVGRGRAGGRRAWDTAAGAGFALFGAFVLHAGRLTPEGDRLGQLVLVALGLAMAAWSLHPDGTGRPRDLSLAIVALGLAQAGLAGALSPADAGGTVWVLAPHLFALVGFTAAQTVVATELSQRAAGQRSRLLASLLAARTEGARRQARAVIDAGHKHDLGSVLLVVDGAARLLADRYSDLADSDRAALAQMLTDGADQLRALVGIRFDEIHEFSVDSVARSVLHAERKLGVPVTDAVPVDLKGVGRPADLAVALRTLVRSAQARSGARSVVLRGERRGEAIVLLLEPADLGPPPPTFSAGPVAPQLELDPDAAEAALDLCVASRLMGEQGGDVWTVRHAGGEVTFGVRLPASVPSAAATPLACAVPVPTAMPSLHEVTA